MKKIIFIFICLLLFVGCGVPYFNIKADNHNLYYTEEFNFFQNYTHIGKFISMHVRYEAEVGDADNWRDPEETFKSGFGDCEDTALLFMNIAYISMNIKMEIVLVCQEDMRLKPEGNVPPWKLSGNGMNHAMVRYNGKIIDPRTGEIYIGTVYESYSFDYVFGL